MFVKIYTLPAHLLALVIPVMLLVWFVLCCVFSGRRRTQGKRISLILFFVWVVAVLAYTVLTREAGGDGELRPLFESYHHMKENDEVLRSNFMNLLLFVPGGLFLATALPGKKPKLRWIRVAVTAILLGLFSAGIEWLQLHFELGLAEMDDVMNNTLGALLGGLGALMCMKAADWVRSLRKKI